MRIHQSRTEILFPGNVILVIQTSAAMILTASYLLCVVNWCNEYPFFFSLISRISLLLRVKKLGDEVHGLSIARIATWVLMLTCFPLHLVLTNLRAAKIGQPIPDYIDYIASVFLLVPVCLLSLYFLIRVRLFSLFPQYQIARCSFGRDLCRELLRK